MSMWSNRIASGAVMVEGLWKGMSRLSNFSIIYVLIQGGCWDISTSTKDTRPNNLENFYSTGWNSDKM